MFQRQAFLIRNFYGISISRAKAIDLIFHHKVQVSYSGCQLSTYPFKGQQTQSLSANQHQLYNKPSTTAEKAEDNEEQILAEEKPNMKRILKEIEWIFADWITNSRDTKNIDKLKPILSRKVHFIDQAKGIEKSTFEHIKIHYILLTMGLHIKYAFFRSEIFGTAIIPEDRRILMVKRFYFIKGGYYPTFANLSFLYRWFTKVFDNTQRDPRKQEILQGTQTSDEFIEIQVNENGLVEHILIRPINQKDYDMVKPYEWELALQQSAKQQTKK